MSHKRPQQRRRPRNRREEDAPGIRNPYLRYRPLKKPPLEPFVTTLWNYPSQHYGTKEQGSQRYRGATPSWVIWQVLVRYAPAGGVVLDPFCGSGTTLDVCKDLGLKGLGFDLQPTRDDIQKADARRLPIGDESVDVAFLDPPYADNLTYSDDARCIGKTKAEDGSWHRAMAEVLLEMERVLRPGGYLALFVCDVLKKGKAFFPLGADLANLGRGRFLLVDHVAVVRHSKDLDDGRYRKAALEEGFFLRGFSHLLLFQKPQGARPPRRRPPKRERVARKGRDA